MKQITLKFDRCGQCPYFQPKGTKMGFGYSGESLCTKSNKVLGNSITDGFREVPEWCLLEDVKE